MLVAGHVLPALLCLLRLSLYLDSPSVPPAAGTVERRLSAMGTVLDIRVEGRDRASALESSEAAAREIARVEALLSTWRPGGPLDRLNAARPGEPVKIGAETAAVLSDVFTWSLRTGGAFDPTVLPLTRAWDLRGAGRIPLEGELSSALAATGRRQFALDTAAAMAWRLSAEAGIDEGAWGKGYALDRAAAALRQAGASSALLDLGGQVLVLGRAPEISRLRRRTRPRVGGTSPMIALSVVERPEPLRPSRLTTSS